MHGVYNALRLWRFLVALGDKEDWKTAKLISRLEELHGVDLVMLDDEEQLIVDQLRIEHNKTVGDFA